MTVLLWAFGKQEGKHWVLKLLFCFVTTGTCFCPCSSAALVQATSTVISSPSPQGYSQTTYILALLGIVLISLVSLGTFALFMGTLLYLHWDVVSLRRRKRVAGRADGAEKKVENPCAKLACVCGPQLAHGEDDTL